jgi:Polyketide cyclase / dehydrase and lipid transport
MADRSSEPDSQVRLTGTLEVALPPVDAFGLFTPRGEQDWVDGWRPRFPVDPVDDTAPGTVFETDAHGERTVWVVVDREPGRRVSYARVTPGLRAGTVTVELEPTERGSLVTVTYDLTALDEPARTKLAHFADGYPAFLRSWQTAIASWLERR